VVDEENREGRPRLHGLMLARTPPRAGLRARRMSRRPRPSTIIPNAPVLRSLSSSRDVERR
jgi:hypothetical protein